MKINFKRNILNSVIQSLKDYPVTLITGSRQVGKSTLVSIFHKKQKFNYISLDDEKILKLARLNSRLFFKKYKPPLIIDEVQKAPNLFNEIEYIVNKTKFEKGSEKANGMFILTGSQKFNLMKGATESMAGRVGIIEMPPLSQTEIKGWNNKEFIINNDVLLKLQDERKLTNDELYSSIVRGFYPARWEDSKNEIINFYSNYIKTYISKDVSEIVEIQKQDKFKNFLSVVASVTGCEFVPDNLAKIVGVDKNTINSWTSILITSNIITLLQPYYENSINKRIVKRQKIYMNDTGLACYLLKIDSAKTLKLSKFKGQIIETYVFNEIKKSYDNKNQQPNLFYYRDNNQNEIDLIILRSGKLNLIEIKSGSKYSSSDIKSFKQLEKTNFEFQGKCIICTCEEAYRISPNIYAFPLRVL